MSIKEQALIKKLQGFVREASLKHSDFMTQAWNDVEFYDGDQWDAQSDAKFEERGIQRITVNKIFPIVNRIFGNYIKNQVDVIVKGRTPEDIETAQVMSESMMYVRDANSLQTIKSRAVKDMLKAGIGIIKTSTAQSPLDEVVSQKYVPWYLFNWDPHGHPDLHTITTRYAFITMYIAKDDLKVMFPSKKDQIENASYDFAISDNYIVSLVEQYNSDALTQYSPLDQRDRIPVREIWYKEFERKAYSYNPQTGEYYEDSEGLSEFVVPVMRVATILGGVLLQDIPTPFNHNDFPFSVYLAYTNRYNKPYGVIRQLRDQAVEVNKRRSMALALMSNRRIKYEHGAVEHPTQLYIEANRLDGMVETKNGKIDKVEISELANLANGQLSLLEQSEREVQEISGVNDEALGYQSKSRTGAALQVQIESAATTLAELFENMKFSEKQLGSQIMSMIKQFWVAPKVLRVTDSQSGVEKFQEVNTAPHNTLANGSFDLVLAVNPMTDTMRAKYLDTIYTAIQKSPETAIGPLITLALEITDLPNKEQVLDQIREATGVNPMDYLSTREERQKRAIAKANAKEEAEQKAQQHEERMAQARLDQEIAKANKYKADAQASLIKAFAVKEDIQQKGYQIGAQVAQMAKSALTPIETPSPEKKINKPNNDVTRVIQQP